MAPILASTKKEIIEWCSILLQFCQLCSCTAGTEYSSAVCQFCIFTADTVQVCAA